MSLQDLLSDYVARINNAVRANLTQTKVLKNNVVTNVTKKLTRLGYLNGYEEQGNYLLVTINLEKTHKLVRVSKPGQRIYASYQNIPKIIGGRGFNILSSSQGILTNFESKRDKLGGELLLQVY